MTSEQIARLRAESAEQAPFPFVKIGRGALDRLLDEREALLEYLRKLRRELPFDGPLEREVAAEIEKADAP